MVPAPVGKKSLIEYLAENGFDTDKMAIVLERYLAKECQDTGVMAENYQLFVYAEVIKNFKELIEKDGE